MTGNNGGLKPTDFGDLLERALRNVITQIEDLDKRLIDIERYIQNDIKNKANAGRILRDI